VAVSSTVVLPAQPTDGVVTYVPLGGDGLTAPQGAYAVVNFELTGASGGGASTLIVQMDPRYCSLVAFASFRILQTTSADADFRLTVGSQTGGRQIPQLLESGPVVAISSVVSNSEINKTLKLQPLILPGAGNVGQLRLDTLNVENDVTMLSALIYLFDIRVRELTPMGPLLFARGAT
jgi:hypothetical protein